MADLTVLNCTPGPREDPLDALMDVLVGLRTRRHPVRQYVLVLLDSEGEVSVSSSGTDDIQCAGLAQAGALKFLSAV